MQKNKCFDGKEDDSVRKSLLIQSVIVNDVFSGQNKVTYFCILNQILFIKLLITKHKSINKNSDNDSNNNNGKDGNKNNNIDNSSSSNNN